jgi:hypothetical protein
MYSFSEVGVPQDMDNYFRASPTEKKSENPKHWFSYSDCLLCDFNFLQRCLWTSVLCFLTACILWDISSDSKESVSSISRVAVYKILWRHVLVPSVPACSFFSHCMLFWNGVLSSLIYLRIVFMFISFIVTHLIINPLKHSGNYMNHQV